MKRRTWLFAGILVFAGLLLLFTAGLGLHSKSMMGMMGSGNDMMTMSGMMWTMRLWGVFVLAVLFAGLAGLFVVCYRLIDHGAARCPRCASTVKQDWYYCPHCGGKLENKRAD